MLNYFEAKKRLTVRWQRKTKIFIWQKLFHMIERRLQLKSISSTPFFLIPFQTSDSNDMFCFKKIIRFNSPVNQWQSWQNMDTRYNPNGYHLAGVNTLVTPRPPWKKIGEETSLTLGLLFPKMLALKQRLSSDPSSTCWTTRLKSGPGDQDRRYWGKIKLGGLGSWHFGEDGEEGHDDR